jgi:hypothetical protein
VRHRLVQAVIKAYDAFETAEKRGVGVDAEP